MEEKSGNFTSGQNLYIYVFSRMKKGLDKYTIIKDYAKSGVAESDARSKIEPLYKKIYDAAVREKYTSDYFQRALLGALAAALAGGIGWGVLALKLDYESAVIAWSIGGLAGSMVVWFTGGKKGTTLQTMAVIASLAGILLGKYIVYFYQYKEIVLQTMGEEAAGKLTYYSQDIIYNFIEEIPHLFEMFDIVWVIVALLTAWRIPKDMGVPVSDSPIPQMFSN